MNEDLFASIDPIEPQEDNKRRRAMVIAAAAVAVILCCALVLVAGWYLGDYVVEWLTSVF